MWTFILAFRDFSWVSVRTNAWDAIGVLSYGLIFAFLESLPVFLAVVLLGFLIPRFWDEGRRVALLCALVLVVSLWAVAGQLYFLLNISPPAVLVNALAGQAHPIRIMFAVTAALVAPTVFIPTYLVLKSEQVFHFVKDLANRLGLLMVIYLILDLAALLVVLFRNLL